MSIRIPPMTHWFDKWVANGADRSIRFQRTFDVGAAHLLTESQKFGRMWLRPRFFPSTGELVQFTIEVRGKEMKRGLDGLILSPLGEDEPRLNEKLPEWKENDQDVEDEYARILEPLIQTMHGATPTEQRLETYFVIGVGGKLSLDRLRIVYLDDVVNTGDAKQRDVILAVFTHLAGDSLTTSQNGGGNGPPEP